MWSGNRSKLKNLVHALTDEGYDSRYVAPGFKGIIGGLFDYEYDIMPYVELNFTFKVEHAPIKNYILLLNRKRLPEVHSVESEGTVKSDGLLFRSNIFQSFSPPAKLELRHGDLVYQSGLLTLNFTINDGEIYYGQNQITREPLSTTKNYAGDDIASIIGLVKNRINRGHRSDYHRTYFACKAPDGKLIYEQRGYDKIIDNLGREPLIWTFVKDEGLKDTCEFSLGPQPGENFSRIPITGQQMTL